MLGCGRSACYAIAHSLAKKGWIRTIEKGKYLLCDISGVPFLDPLQAATKLIWPSYISFWTALNFYKLTEQVPQTIFVATTRQRRDLRIGGRKVKFVRMAKKRFYGYVKTGEVVIAEKEKAIVDSLLHPGYAGGIAEVAKALLEAKGDVSAEKLAEYAIGMGSDSLAVRLGYLLEHCGYELAKNTEEKLLRFRRGSFPKLDTAGPRIGRIDKKWGVLVNLRIAGQNSMGELQ